MKIKITLTRAEGPIKECKTVELDSFYKANSQLSIWSRNVSGGGYDKCPYIIEIDGEEVYSGRIDLKRDDNVLIQDAMIETVSFYAGKANWAIEKYGEGYETQYGDGKEANNWLDTWEQKVKDAA